MEFRSIAIVIVTVFTSLNARGEFFVAEGYRLDLVAEITPPRSPSSPTSGTSLALTTNALVTNTPNGLRKYDATSGDASLTYTPPTPTRNVWGGELVGVTGIAADTDYTLVGGTTLQLVNGRLGLANVYDTETGEHLRTLYSDETFSSDPYLQAVAHDGQYAVVSLYGQGVYVFNIETGEQIAQLEGVREGNGVFGVSVAIDNGVVVVGSPNEFAAQEGGPRGAVYTFDASTGAMINRWTSPSNATNGFGVAVAADDGIAIVGNDRHYAGRLFYTSNTGTNTSGPDPNYAGDLEDDDYDPGDDPGVPPAGLVYALDLHTGAILSTLSSSAHPHAGEYWVTEFGFTLRMSGHLALVSKWDFDGDGVAEGTPVSVYDVRNGNLIASLEEEYMGGVALDGNRFAALQAYRTDQGVPVIKVFAIVPEPSTGLLATVCVWFAVARRQRRWGEETKISNGALPN